ncbi:MAG: polysaccharide biosynthesis tyrosine autokinase [Candidatus Hydrogenedentota bacterium]
MKRAEPTIRDYLNVLFRRKWLVVFSIVTAIIVSHLIILKQKPTYYSSASIEFKTGGAIQQNVLGRPVIRLESSIQTAMQIIQSKRVAKEALSILVDLSQLTQIGKDKYIKIYTPQQIEKIIAYFLIDKNLNDEERAKAIIQKSEIIRNSIYVSRDPKTNYIIITASFKDPLISSAIANSVAEAYIRVESEDRINLQQRTREFITSEIEYAANEWRLSAEQLSLFEDYVKYSNEIAKIAEERNRLINVLNNLQKNMEVEGEIPLFRTGESSIDQILNEYRSQYVSALKEFNRVNDIYTEIHPQVEKAKSNLERVKSDLYDELQVQIQLIDDRVNRTLKKETEVNKLLDDIKNKLDKESLQDPYIATAYQEFKVEKNSTLWKLLNTKLYDSQLFGDDSGVVIVDLANLGTVRGGLSKNVTYFVGLLIGLIIGIAFSFLVESLDTSIGTVEEVEDLLGIPVLGVIPRINIQDSPALVGKQEKETEKEPFSPLLVTYFEPKSIVSESYRTLRTNLQFIGFKDRYKTLTVTSSGPQEGKTTTLVNLGILMANMGYKTLIVSTNLRRPAIHKFFGFQRDPGIVNYLVGGAEWRELVLSTGINNLYFISSGPLPPNPAELLSSAKMDDFIKEAWAEYDKVLFDSPPIIPVTDACILTSKTDGVLLVYFYKRAAREAVLRSKELISNVGGNIWGVCLNYMQPEGEMGPSYYYSYHYAYYGDKDEEELAFQYYEVPKEDTTAPKIQS